MEEPWAERAELIALLGHKLLSEQTRAQVVARGAAVIGPLIEILDDEALFDDDAPGFGWAPIHAATLLGDLKAADAITAMLRTLATTGWDHILHDRVLQALPRIGAPIVEPLLELHDEWDDDTVDGDSGLDRSVILGALASAGVRDDRIYDRLLAALADDPELVAPDLAEYGDRRALPHVRRLLDDLEVEPGGPFANRAIIEFADATIALGGTLSPGQEHKLARATTRAVPSPAVPGRNDPCWCGSGTKYKKCHLAADQGPTA